jgi:2-C-methyl-D-erythritol 4-phosphate cytidylyltransferase
MSDRIWVVIPAAGVGRRMAGAIPKQYLSLNDRTVIEWSLAPVLARPDVAVVLIALSPSDNVFATLPLASDARVRTTFGGVERSDSVLNGLNALQADDRDWVLVHDAARPCLHADDLDALINSLRDDDVGGLLATPVADTLKSSNENQRVSLTVPRKNLWRALTPQMFRFDVLHRALSQAAASGVTVTDESAAVERLGLSPKLVAGRSDNIKITVPEDLALAGHILSDHNLRSTKVGVA